MVIKDRAARVCIPQEGRDMQFGRLGFEVHQNLMAGELSLDR